MSEVRYRYELDAAALDYILKLLGTRPHDEVRGLYDHFLRGKMEQEREQEIIAAQQSANNMGVVAGLARPPQQLANGEVRQQGG